MPWSIQSTPILCITLERRLDRWKRFRDQPGLDGLNVTRFKGVDGKTIDIVNDDRVALSTKRNILRGHRRSHEELDSVGGVGCALSHIAVWQWMVDNNQEVAIIFEDDALVPPDFASKMSTCLKAPFFQDPKKWDMWLLGGRWADLTEIPGTDKRDVVRVGAFYLFHAYVMTLHGAKRLLKDVYPIHCHIDLWVSIFANVHDFRMVGSPKLVLDQCTRVKTDIQSEKGCDICDIPVNYGSTHVLVSKDDWVVARGAEIVCIGLMGYLVYRYFYERKA